MSACFMYLYAGKECVLFKLYCIRDRNNCSFCVTNIKCWKQILFLMHKKENNAWKRNIQLVFDKHKTKPALFKQCDSWLYRTSALENKHKWWLQTHRYSTKMNFEERWRKLYSTFTLLPGNICDGVCDDRKTNSVFVTFTFIHSHLLNALLCQKNVKHVFSYILV